MHRPRQVVPAPLALCVWLISACAEPAPVATERFVPPVTGTSTLAAVPSGLPSTPPPDAIRRSAAPPSPRPTGWPPGEGSAVAPAHAPDYRCAADGPGNWVCTLDGAT